MPRGERVSCIASGSLYRMYSERVSYVRVACRLVDPHSIAAACCAALGGEPPDAPLPDITTGLKKSGDYYGSAWRDGGICAVRRTSEIEAKLKGRQQ